MRGMALCFPAVDENFWITPPRARGRPGVGFGFQYIKHNTPACAGKTERFSPTTSSSQDHSRMRGEDAPVLLGQQRVG